MSATQTNNVAFLAIGKDVAISTGGINTLGDGEIGIFSPGGTRQTEATAATVSAIQIVVGGASSRPAFTSDIIKRGSIKSIARKKYAADTQQSTVIGSNGTTGSIEAINSNLYMVQMYIEELLRSSSDGRLIKHFQYKSDATTNQAEVAIGLTGSAVSNFSREAEKYVKFKAVCDVALASDFAFDNSGFDITVIYGSKRILSAAATPTYNTGTALAVGDFLRMGTATGADGTVALASDVYKVISLPSTTEIELDRPVGVTSATYVDNGGNITVIPAATGIAANWGVIATGLARTINSTGKIFNKLSTWTTNIKDFGTTTFVDTKSIPGTGTLAQLRDLEWFLQGNKGETYRMGEPTIHSYTSKVETAEVGYDIISINFVDDITVGFQNEVSPKTLYLATPEGMTAGSYTLAGTADDITDVLEAFATTALIAAGGLELA